MKDEGISRRSFIRSAAAAGLAAGFSTPLPAFAENLIKDKNSKTAFIYSDKYLSHLLSEGHPESPKRLEAILKRLRDSGLEDDLIKIAPEDKDATEWISKVHSEKHIKLVEKQARSPEICRLAVSGALAAVDAVCTGKAKNAFCALRPPGHHATDTGEYGFCFFNNVAIAAKFAKEKYGLKRILIADWDFHHGNGTEWTFYEDPSVFFFSTHKLEAFPFTGFPDRKGKGEGYGFNINAPLPSGADDKAIIDAFENKLLPAAENFKPELILISAGFDCRKDDLLGDFKVTDKGIARLTEMIMGLAGTYSKSRVVSLLEGGYNTGGLALAVESHLTMLLK
ncbi:MAG TPA: histone deacetylase [Lentisphaeria bacterium]|nr:histone deacetylase [Lentisphaeria bacterium]